MPDTPTPNYGLTKSTIGGDKNVWGDALNGNADLIDTQMKINEDAADAGNTNANTRVLKAGDTMTGPLVVPTVTGNVTGDVTGNVLGDLTGNVTGNADTATALDAVALSAAGITDLVGIADQAEAEAGADNTKAMTPLRVQQALDNSPAPTSPIKAWGSFTCASGSIQASSNINSVSRTASRHYTVIFTTALADANYAVVTGLGENASDQRFAIAVYDRTTAQFKIRVTFTTLADLEPDQVFFSVIR